MNIQAALRFDSSSWATMSGAMSRSFRSHARATRSTTSIRQKARTASRATERNDEFEYDPQNPVRTIGGRLCCGQAIPPGPADQRANESRPDVLVFSTPPLTEDTEVTGFISLELY